MSGLRQQRHIAYDEDFRMLTLPTTQKGTAKLRPGRGIKVNYLYYWSDAFLDPDIEGTQVPVRYDPFDAVLRMPSSGNGGCAASPNTTLGSRVGRNARSSWQAPSCAADNNDTISNFESPRDNWRTFSRL